MPPRAAIPPCPICQSDAVDALPAPHPARAMVSDGAIRHEPLLKKSCRACGAVSHLVAPSPERVARFYGDGYTLGLVAGAAERARIGRQAEFVLSKIARPPRRMLEAGCGGGHLLEALGAAWPTTALHGLEAAPGLADRGTAGRARIEHGFLESWAGHGDGFDLIIAINVIEHAVDPAAFLGALAGHLATDGEALLVCPSANVNLELLFLDHIHTLTPTALDRLARTAGLSVIEHGLVPAFGDFQFVRLARAAAPFVTVEPDRGDERARYLEGWRDLDAILRSRLPDGPVTAFGAGEMAALLRAYAPTLFARIERFVVDDVTGARPLGVPIEPLAARAPAETGPLLLAAHPRAHPALDAKLTALGYRVITWDDVIPR